MNRKNHRRPAENIIFKRNALIDRNVILYFAAIPDNRLWSNDYILTNITIPTNTRIFHNMAEMPYFSAITNRDVFINVT